MLRILLVIREAFSGERVFHTVTPAARKLAADCAVAFGPGMRHQHFGTVIQRRNSPHGQVIDHRHLIQVVVLAELRVDATHVVVVGKNDEIAGVRVEKVVAQHLVDGSPRAIPPGHFLG